MNDPEPKPKPLDEVMLTVSEDASKAVEAMIDGAQHFFERDGEVPSAVSCITEESEPHVYPALHRNDVEKQCIWAFIRFLRETHPVVLLISEVWMSVCKGKDHKQYPRPSQDPNRLERVMITLWDRKRTLWIAADITRKPRKLGEFLVRFDSSDSESEIGGALAEGKPYQGKERYGQR